MSRSTVSRTIHIMVVLILLLVCGASFDGNTADAEGRYAQGPVAPNNDATFDPPIRILESPDVIDTQPSLALDSMDHVHIVYMGTHLQAGAPDGVATDIYYTSNVDGGFSTPVSIAVPTGYYSYRPTIVLDSADKVHIAFSRQEDQNSPGWEDEIYYVNNQSGSFTNPQIIVEGQRPGGFRAPGEPIIGIDSRNVVHIAFQAGSSASFYDQVYYTNNFSGSFMPPVRVTHGLYNVQNYVMVLDDRGWPHFAVQALEHTLLDDSQTFYVQAVDAPDPEPAFSSEVNVSNWPRSTHDFWPAIAVDAERKVHIAFRDPFGLISRGDNGIWYTNNTGETFSTPAKMQSVGGFGTWLQADSEGTIHGAWKAPSYYMEYNNNSGGGFDIYDDVRMTYIGGGGFFGPRFFAVGPTGHLHATYSEYPSYDIYYVHGTYPITSASYRVFLPRLETAAGRGHAE